MSRREGHEIGQHILGEENHLKIPDLRELENPEIEFHLGCFRALSSVVKSKLKISHPSETPYAEWEDGPIEIFRGISPSGTSFFHTAEAFPSESGEGEIEPLSIAYAPLTGRALVGARPRTQLRYRGVVEPGELFIPANWDGSSHIIIEQDAVLAVLSFDQKS